MAGRGSTETEIKLKVTDSDAMQQRLSAAGFRVTKPRVFEANTLYDYPDQTLRSRNNILRIREAGGKAILTYKGPAESAKHKAREELETAIGDAATGAHIFERIGLLPGFRYEKYRTEYERPNEAGVVTLDETPIGWFLELEGEPGWIDKTAAELEFRESDYITLSYGSLYVQHCTENGILPRLMIFEGSTKVSTR